MVHKNIDIRSLLILVDGSHPTDIINSLYLKIMLLFAESIGDAVLIPT